MPAKSSSETFRDLLSSLLNRHTTLANAVLMKAKKGTDVDTRYFMEVTAASIFLAGVDKVLGISLQLLYLDGVIKWNWIKPQEPRSGYVGCGPNLRQKLHKLERLGADLAGLEELLDLQISFHQDYGIIAAGYRIAHADDDPSKMGVQIVGPDIQFPRLVTKTISAEYLLLLENHILDEVLRLLAQAKGGWGWFRLRMALKELPADPVGIRRSIASGIRYATLSKRIDQINLDFIGEGFRRLRFPKASG